MPQTADTPVTLLTVANDMEAAIVVGALADQKVDAMMVGGFTAGFIAEAPGGVSILVRQQDLAKSREVLADMQDAFPDTNFTDTNTEPESAESVSSSESLASLRVALKTLGLLFAPPLLVWFLVECFW